MRIFSYKCKSCGAKQEVRFDQTPVNCCTAPAIIRDYRADMPDVFIPMHMSARNTSNKSDFLPTAKDYESPSDPTGEKGMKEWKDTHQLKGSREI